MAKRLELQIVSGPKSGSRYSVAPEGMRLGRSSSNDIHVPDEELSRNHCLFEQSGAAGLKVTDLASANGTLLNGTPLGSEPAELKLGDLIEVGKTVLKVVGEGPDPVKVDLGLDAGAAAATVPPARRRSPFVNVLWAVAVAGAAVGVWYLAMEVGPQPEAVQARDVSAEEPQVREVYYEKVKADSEGIFRFSLSMGVDGILKVAVDDVPAADRNVPMKQKPLTPEQRAILNEIVAFDAVQKIDREYAGPDTEPPTLNSWRLRVVYSNRVRSVKVVNTVPPDQFRQICEKIEAYASNELGIMAIQHPREKLIEMAEQALQVAQSKWDEREVLHGNLFEAVSAYREAMFCLETVNPKPDCFETARAGCRQAEEELDRRYGEHRFLAERAISMTRWEEARNELRTLLEMIPDRTDERNRAASVKLMDIEKRLKGGN